MNFDRISKTQFHAVYELQIATEDTRTTVHNFTVPGGLMAPRGDFIKIEKPIDSTRLTFMKFRLVRDRSALLHFPKRAFAAFACREY